MHLVIVKVNARSLSLFIDRQADRGSDWGNDDCPIRSFHLIQFQARTDLIWLRSTRESRVLKGILDFSIIYFVTPSKSIMKSTKFFMSHYHSWFPHSFMEIKRLLSRLFLHISTQPTSFTGKTFFWPAGDDGLNSSVGIDFHCMHQIVDRSTQDCEIQIVSSISRMCNEAKLWFFESICEMFMVRFSNLLRSFTNFIKWK
jgi:hypothetical protein